MTSDLVTIATDCRQTLPQCVLRIEELHDLTRNGLKKHGEKKLK